MQRMHRAVAYAAQLSSAQLDATEPSRAGESERATVYSNESLSTAAASRFFPPFASALSVSLSHSLGRFAQVSATQASSSVLINQSVVAADLALEIAAVDRVCDESAPDDRSTCARHSRRRRRRCRTARRLIRRQKAHPTNRSTLTSLSHTIQTGAQFTTPAAQASCQARLSAARRATVTVARCHRWRVVVVAAAATPLRRRRIHAPGQPGARPATAAAAPATAHGRRAAIGRRAARCAARLIEALLGQATAASDIKRVEQHYTGAIRERVHSVAANDDDDSDHDAGAVSDANGPNYNAQVAAAFQRSELAANVVFGK